MNRCVDRAAFCKVGDVMRGVVLGDGARGCGRGRFGRVGSSEHVGFGKLVELAPSATRVQRRRGRVHREDVVHGAGGRFLRCVQF